MSVLAQMMDWHIFLDSMFLPHFLSSKFCYSLATIQSCILSAASGWRNDDRRNREEGKRVELAK